MKSRRNLQKILILNFIFILNCVSPNNIFPQKKISKELSPRQIAQQTLPSTVLLVMNNKITKKSKSGSGFFVAEDIVATNFHVVKETTEGYAKIYNQEKIYEILGLVGVDETNDLALVKIKGIKGKSLKLNADNSTVIGDTVFAVGNPQGLEGTFSQGIVSSIRKTEKIDLIQITAPISAGSSGGAVLNNKGEVIGVAVGAFESGQSLNFAIPVSNLKLLIGKQENLIDLSSQKNTGEGSTQKVDCNNLIFDLDRGNVSGVKGTASIEEIKVQIPCFTGFTSEGELWLNRGGGVFFNTQGIYFGS